MNNFIIKSLCRLTIAAALVFNTVHTNANTQASSNIQSSRVVQSVVSQSRPELLNEQLSEKIGLMLDSHKDGLSSLNESSNALRECDQHYTNADREGFEECFVGALYDISSAYGVVAQSYSGASEQFSAYLSEVNSRMALLDSGIVKVRKHIAGSDVLIAEQKAVVVEMIQAISNSATLSKKMRQEVMRLQVDYDIAQRKAKSVRNELSRLQSSKHRLGTLVGFVDNVVFTTELNATRANANVGLVADEARIVSIEGYQSEDKQMITLMQPFAAQPEVPMFAAQAQVPSDDAMLIPNTNELSRDGLMQMLNAMLNAQGENTTSAEVGDDE